MKLNPASFVGLALLVTLAVVGVEAWREFCAARVVVVSEMTQRSHVLSAENFWWEGVCAPRCPERARLAEAAARLSVAARLPPSQKRSALIAVARDLVDHATAAEPLNGAAWSERAYLQYVENADDPSVLTRLDHSYDVQRFQRTTGRWRIAFAGHRWTSLSPRLRRYVLDEAQWLWTIDPRLRPEVAAAFPTEGGQLALSLRVGGSLISAPDEKS